METQQSKFWKGNFGKDYTDRNTLNHRDWNQSYIEKYGISKLALNERFMADLPRDIKILEVGCNTGQQLEGLQKQGFEHLYGLELQWYAVEKAKDLLEQVNIVQGSGFDIPFKDSFFDLVCTNGVLIHIAPQDLPAIMGEIYRCSKKYIMGFEYFADTVTAINYRGNEEYLWKADYAKLYQEYFPDLQLVKKELIPYISESEQGNKDSMFLLEKK